MDEGPETEKVRNFNDYVTSTWVDYEAQFPVRISTQYGNIGPRTNNHLEGWHLKLKNLIAKAHPNIYLFICNIKKIEAVDKAKRAQLDCGALPKSRKRVYRELDARLLRLKEHLQSGRKTPLQYLDAAGHLIKFAT
ncbi:uncharacterized protein LOC124277702 [Haliotis rubra]|uniref:uncharacterized protein LOC124277702 n=1 Tax=Haliotis rubra TaxID=36100 RepID=UPI001EE4F2F3|nr:uncharacterized protein LOC124277702 [Haliotis rubra]